MNNKAIKEHENDYSGTKLIAISIVAVVGYKRYKKFKDFIENLKLSIRINDFSTDHLIVNIMPLNALGIPYKVKTIDLIYQKKSLVATTSNCDLNKRIVAMSKIPITLNNLIFEITEENILQSEIALTFSFCGFSVKRLYIPIQGSSEQISSEQRKVIDIKPNTNCGCK